MDLQTEKKLIAQCKKDISYFSVLYETYSEKLYRYIYARVNNKDKALDITSEVFLRALQNFSRYTYQGRPFIAWLYIIAHNLIVDSYKNKPQISLEEFDSFVAEEDDSQLDKLGDQEMKERLKKIISTLPPLQRDILLLKSEEGLTFAQIADLKGKTEGAVKMQYYRTLDLLKVKLKEEHGFNLISLLFCFF